MIPFSTGSTHYLMCDSKDRAHSSSVCRWFRRLGTSRSSTARRRNRRCPDRLRQRQQDVMPYQQLLFVLSQSSRPSFMRTHSN